MCRNPAYIARQGNSVHMCTPRNTHSLQWTDDRRTHVNNRCTTDTGCSLARHHEYKVQPVAVRAVARPGRRGFNDDDAKGRSPVSTDWKMTLKSTKMTANDSRIIIETYRQRCIGTRLVTNCRKISRKTNSFAENEQISATMFTINCLCVRSRDPMYAVIVGMSLNMARLLACL